jgi:hypothetical protein
MQHLNSGQFAVQYLLTVQSRQQQDPEIEDAEENCNSSSATNGDSKDKNNNYNNDQVSNNNKGLRLAK